MPNAILVAHDFSEPAARALALGAEIARRLPAQLHVLHVHPDVYRDHASAGLGVAVPSSVQEARYTKFLDGELQRLVCEVLGDETSQARRIVVRGDPVRRIIDVAKELNAYLVCVGSTGKGAVERMLLGSVSQRLIRSSPAPILTVH